MSATHRASGPAALKWRCTRSGAGRASASRTVVLTHLRRLTPCRPAAAHQPRHALAAHLHALLAELGMHPRHPVGLDESAGGYRWIAPPAARRTAPVPRAHDRAMRRSRWWRPPAADTWWPPSRRPDSPSRIRILVGDRIGLPCEPGRGFCQDLALELELPVLPAQLAELLALDAGQHVLALALRRPRPGRPSCGWSAPSTRTRWPAHGRCDRREPGRRSCAGTPAGMADLDFGIADTSWC